DAQHCLPLFNGIDEHPDDERLHRAMAHYREALGSLDPLNRVMAAEFLFMACENLGHVILRRLYREAGLPDTGASKHQLAVSAGFRPVNERSRVHLNNFEAHLRSQYIFGGDKTLYDQL